MKWLLLVLVGACGGAHASSRQPPPIADTVAGGPAKSPDCDALITHALELGIAEHKGQSLTEEDRLAIDRELRSQLRSSCRGLSPPGYQCAMAATTLEALAACDGS